MKKKTLKVALVAAFALIAGFNVYNSQKADGMSDFALANVEALASPEMNTSDCIPLINAECGVLIVTPNGSWGEIYAEQTNKSY